MFDDFENERRFHALWSAVRIERASRFSLFTFGETLLPYYLVCEGRTKGDLVTLRKGEVRVTRPTIITPRSLQPEFQNFFEEAELENLIDFLLARSAAFSNVRAQNESGPAQIVSDSTEEVVQKLNRQLDDEEEDRMAILCAPPQLAGVAVLRYTAEQIWESTPDNVQELRERGFLP